MAGSQLIGSPRCNQWVPQQFSFWLLELGNSRFEASLPHKCGVPKLAGTPHLCGRAPKTRIADKARQPWTEGGYRVVDGGWLMMLRIISKQRDRQGERRRDRLKGGCQ